MRLIDADKVLAKIKNPYEQALVAKWLDMVKPVTITWADKEQREFRPYCKKTGYLCEFAAPDGSCRITCCVKNKCE